MHNRAFGPARKTATCFAIAATLLSIFVVNRALPAQAATSSTDQHWELLGEPKTLASGSTGATIPLQRGQLPGGTSKFDPAPTVTFEVVGRHTNGAGNSKWDVSLNYNTSTPVVVSFFANESTFKLKSTSFSWPSTDKSLVSISLSKTNDGLNLAGGLEITKAYLSIRQTGVIKKTVTRVSLATKQIGITNTAWQDVTDPFVYKHIAGDFSPTPNIYLRTSGAEVTSNPILLSLHVRLVDSSGTAVTGAENLHTQFASVTSSAISLVDGTSYHLQVNVTQAPESGELHSADLVFEQSTSDVLGLVKTLGWYSSVSSATQITANNAFFNFPFTPPQLSVSAVTATTLYSSIKRLTCSSGSVGVDLRNVGTSALIAGGQTTASSSLFDNLAAESDAPPAADTSVRWDSKSVLATGCAARLAGSALRLVLRLRALPTIASLSATNPAFSPNNDGVKDSTTISAQVTADSVSPTWTFEVRDTNANLVRTFTGTLSCPSGCASPTTVTQSGWNGTNSGGTPLDEGEYSVQAFVADGTGATAQTAALALFIDLTAPVIRIVAPQDGSNVLFASQKVEAFSGDGLSDIDRATSAVSVTDLTTNTTTTPSSSVEGLLIGSQALTLVDGRDYRATVTLKDAAGNTVSRTSTFRAIHGSVDVPTVSSASQSATQVQSGSQDDTYTWQEASLSVAPFDIFLSQSTHTSGGAALVDVATHLFTVSYTLGGNSYNALTNENETRTARVPYTYVAGGNTTVQTSTFTASLGTLTATLPKNATNVRLQLASQQATASRFNACVDPTAQEMRCTPDPLLSSAAWSLLSSHPSYGAANDSNPIARATGDFTPDQLTDDKAAGGWSPDPLIVYEEHVPSSSANTQIAQGERQPDGMCAFTGLASPPSMSAGTRYTSEPVWVDRRDCTFLVNVTAATPDPNYPKPPDRGKCYVKEPTEHQWVAWSIFCWQDFVGLQVVDTEPVIEWNNVESTGCIDGNELDFWYWDYPFRGTGWSIYNNQGSASYNCAWQIYDKYELDYHSVIAPGFFCFTGWLSGGQITGAEYRVHLREHYIRGYSTQGGTTAEAGQYTNGVGFKAWYDHPYAHGCIGLYHMGSAEMDARQT